MRLPLVWAVALTALGPAALAGPAPTGRYSNFVPAENCRDLSMRFADKEGPRQRVPDTPRKLAELPPAEGYAAVYLLDDRGCMVPVKYRDVRR